MACAGTLPQSEALKQMDILCSQINNSCPPSAAALRCERYAQLEGSLPGSHLKVN